MLDEDARQVVLTLRYARNASDAEDNATQSANVRTHRVALAALRSVSAAVELASRNWLAGSASFVSGGDQLRFSVELGVHSGVCHSGRCVDHVEWRGIEHWWPLPPPLASDDMVREQPMPEPAALADIIDAKARVVVPSSASTSANSSASSLSGVLLDLALRAPSAIALSGRGQRKGQWVDFEVDSALSRSLFLFDSFLHFFISFISSLSLFL